MENYIWTMIMASWTPLIIHDSYELQTSMISDHSKWGFIRFTRSMITHDCYEHWLWAITVHRNSYEFGFWTINDQTHHTWWGGINAMKCCCSYMINTDSVSYYDPYQVCTNICIWIYIHICICIIVCRHFQSICNCPLHQACPRCPQCQLRGWRPPRLPPTPTRSPSSNCHFFWFLSISFGISSPNQSHFQTSK